MTTIKKLVSDAVYRSSLCPVSSLSISLCSLSLTGGVHVRAPRDQEEEEEEHEVSASCRLLG